MSIQHICQHYNFSTIKKLLTTSIALLLLASCSGEVNLDHDVSNSDTSDSSEMLSAKALSNHYVEVAFAESSSASAATPDNYLITAPDGSRLNIIEANLSHDHPVHIRSAPG